MTKLNRKSEVTSLLYLRSTGHKEGSHDSVLQLDSLLEWLTELRKTVYLLLLVSYKGYIQLRKSQIEEVHRIRYGVRHGAPRGQKLPAHQLKKSEAEPSPPKGRELHGSKVKASSFALGSETGRSVWAVQALLY